jgi:uncharacterized protein (UPF0332 family)
MTTTTDRVSEIFADARTLQDSAVQKFREGDIRDAAEKAWCAAKRAADALILARTGFEPEATHQTSRELGRLATANPSVKSLLSRYYSRQAALHGNCFYLGNCEPIDETERRIRETLDSIEDAESLAGIS